MKKKQTETEEKEPIGEKDGKIVSLEQFKKNLLALASKEPPGNNWLDKLPVGTMFFAENNDPQDYIAREYLITDKLPGIVVCDAYTTNGVLKDIPILSNKFCLTHKLKYIWGTFNTND